MLSEIAQAINGVLGGHVWVIRFLVAISWLIVGFLIATLLYAKLYLMAYNPKEYNIHRGLMRFLL